MPAHHPLSTLSHCYPEWHNFPVICCIMYTGGKLYLTYCQNHPNIYINSKSSSTQWRHQELSKRWHEGAFSLVGGSATPHLPSLQEKYGKSQPFLSIFFGFFPLRNFAPSMPPPTNMTNEKTKSGAATCST